MQLMRSLQPVVLTSRLNINMNKSYQCFFIYLFELLINWGIYIEFYRMVRNNSGGTGCDNPFHRSLFFICF